MDVTLDLGAPFEAKLEIIRKDESGIVKFYGARFLELDEQQGRTLRTYLLRQQVEAYFKLKQLDGKEQRK